jgi:hypothetical protein
MSPVPGAGQPVPLPQSAQELGHREECARRRRPPRGNPAPAPRHSATSDPRWPEAAVIAARRRGRRNLLASAPQDRPSAWQPGSGRRSRRAAPSARRCSCGRRRARAPARWPSPPRPTSRGRLRQQGPAAPWQGPARCPRAASGGTGRIPTARAVAGQDASRHGDPALVRQQVPSGSCRLARLRDRPASFPRGSRGSSTFHSQSARWCRPGRATTTAAARPPLNTP